MQLLRYMLRYLRRTQNQGIMYSLEPHQTPLNTYSDSYFAACSPRHSHEGSVHTSFGSPISWHSKRHKTIILSTCEAKYLAASHALQETLWLQRMLSDLLPIPQTTPSPFTSSTTEQSRLLRIMATQNAASTLTFKAITSINHAKRGELPSSTSNLQRTQPTS